MKRVVQLLFIGLIAACSASNTVASTSPRLVISLPANVISVTRGNRVAIAAAVTREDGPANPVTVTASAPTGITVSVASTTTSGTTTTAELEITVNSATASGTYTVVITSRATGYPDATATLSLDLN